MGKKSKRWEFVKKDVIAPDDDRVLTRIRALVDMPLHNVKAGDLGGYIEHKRNLPHEEHAWVADEAQVSGWACLRGFARAQDRAHVCHEAQVSGHARLVDNALIGEYAQVGEYALVGGNTWIRGGARINGRAEIFDQAVVTDGARVEGHAKIRDSIYISNEAIVCGNVTLMGSATICDQADIRCNADWAIFGPDPANGYVTTVFRDRDLGLRFHIGINNSSGTFEDFEKIFKEKYADNKQALRYYKIIRRTIAEMFLREKAVKRSTKK